MLIASGIDSDDHGGNDYATHEERNNNGKVQDATLILLAGKFCDFELGVSCLFVPPQA